uniref:CBS domain-containing protein n=1 Tax=Setaria viridis TaxID=4556 RepID=A0A4U6WHA9_SETVI|nr:hypothetical protein SEVIR_1G373832v2 [Setaria viridis]
MTGPKLPMGSALPSPLSHSLSHNLGDRAKASHGPQTKIEEVMTSPAITLASDKTVMDAAVLMLKKKIHRVPIVNQDEQVIGIITRADVLRELEGLLKI